MASRWMHQEHQSTASGNSHLLVVRDTAGKRLLTTKLEVSGDIRIDSSNLFGVGKSTPTLDDFSTAAEVNGIRVWNDLELHYKRPPVLGQDAYIRYTTQTTADWVDLFVEVVDTAGEE